MSTTQLRKMLTRARRAPKRPGVYRMFNDKGDVLYVGKAKNLQARVSSYFSGQATNSRILTMVNAVETFEYTVTRTEAEALLLEDSFVKEWMPIYNVKLRDGKTYPWLRLDDSEYPLLDVYRGPTDARHEYFGPFPNVKMVRQTLTELRKAFKLRNCSNSVFKSRQRPCLEYQIGNCSAPCVQKISHADYLDDCDQLRGVLRGEHSLLQERISQKMKSAAAELNYEKAAELRNRIELIVKLQESMTVQTTDLDSNLDIVVAERKNKIVCVSLLVVRAGTVVDTFNEYLELPPTAEDDSDESQQELMGEAMQSFLVRWYTDRQTWAPGLILARPKPIEQDLVNKTLTAVLGRKIVIRERFSEQHRRWLGLAEANLKMMLQEKTYSQSKQFQTGVEALAEALGLDISDEMRIEAIDISHHQGEQTVGSVVVYNRLGRIASDWRAYILPNADRDDYLAMAMTLEKRFKSRNAQLPKLLPNLLIVDGGRGQVARVLDTLKKLGIAPMQIKVVGVAKGEQRKAAFDKLLIETAEGIVDLSLSTAAKSVVQTLRDAAHNNGVRANRKRMRATRVADPLLAIPGVGPKLSQLLLSQFGGYKGLRHASVDKISAIPRVGKALAQSIYDQLHLDE